MSKSREKLLIIDGNAIVHRSFHALPSTMKTKTGEVTNAVYGFASFLMKAIRELKPEYVVLTMDKKGPTFRHKKFKDYKAKRVKAPDELYQQIPRVKELAQAFDIPIFELSGYEADDLIGTISHFIADKKLNVESIILTGDMDTLQLVDSNTKVYSMSRGLNESIVYDEKTVKNRLGIKPEQVIDYKALRGDPSDNIPGVKGVGEKTAVNLLLEYKNLDNIYTILKSPDKQGKLKKIITPRIIDLLLQHQKEAYLSRELATIKCDIKIDFNLEKTKFNSFDQEKVIKFMSEMEFTSLLPRLQSLVNSSVVSTKEEQAKKTRDKFERNKIEFKYHLIDINRKQDEIKFKKFLSDLKKQKVFTFDTETSSFDPITCDLLGISFAWQAGLAYYIRVEREKAKKPGENIDLFNYQTQSGSKLKKPAIQANPWLEKLKPIFEDLKVKKRAHNAKYDIRVLKNSGINVRGVDFDTMIASYLLNPGTRQYNLDALTFSELKFEKISKDDLLGKGRDRIKFNEAEIEKLSLYSCEDADFTNRLVVKLQKKLKAEKADKLFNAIEMPLVNVLVGMEEEGVKIDKKFLSIMHEKLEVMIAKLTKKIFKQAGEEFNISSTKQLQEILYTKLQIPTDRVVKTKTGISTAASELDKLKDLHPIILLIQEFRELTKLQSTYIDALPALINPITKRVHTSFNQTVTATGRLSSTDPNLQNIPIRTKLGREIRKAFIAEKGFKMAAFDYSQIELRLAAHMSGDKKMIEAFKNNADIHTSTAAEINQVAPEAVDKQMRREAKAINFGILYGQGPHGLSQTADIPYWRAKEFIDNYFAVFQDVKKYIDQTVAEAREKGYVKTLFGRKRYLPEINSSVAMLRKGAERMAVNTPLQGTAADMIKAAMIEINKIIHNKSDIKMIIQVHDELVFEINEEKLLKFTKQIKNIMEGVIKLKVPIAVDVKQGKNWGEMEDVKQ